MPTPNILFRFIRTEHSGNVKKETYDDLCRITKVNDEFHLSFSYTIGKSLRTNTLIANADTIQLWTRRIIDLLKRDADPFKEMQVDFPLLPSILFEVANIQDNYHAILDAVEFSVDNWPTSAKKDKEKEKAPVNEYHYVALPPSVDTYVDEDADDEYADLPPLVDDSYHYDVNSRIANAVAHGRHHLFLD